jgi:hypothetical protein
MASPGHGPVGVPKERRPTLCGPSLVDWIEITRARANSTTSFDHELHLTAALVDDSKAILGGDELVIPEFGNTPDHRRGERAQRNVAWHVGAFHQRRQDRGCLRL